jgi:putative MATE family efflux protein
MHDLTQGSIAGHVARYAAFIFATLLVQTLYFLVDLYFVGHVGSEAVAAVSIAGNLMFLVMALTTALGVGTTTLVSQAVGAKDVPGAEHAVNQSQALSLGIGLGFGLVAFATRRGFAEAFAADAATAELVVAYLDWFIPALTLQFAMVAAASALRGAGDVKFASIVQVATLLINIVLAPVLVAGWGTGMPLGVAGAGLATFIAVLVGTAWVMWAFTRPDAMLRLHAAFWRAGGGLDLALWRRLAAIGAPAGGEFLMMAVLLGTLQAILAGVGADAQAGFGVGLRLMQAIFLPAMAVAFAVAPIAGQNVGARLPHRIRECFRVALIGSCGIMLIATGLAHLAPEALVGAFAREPAAAAIGVDYIRIVSWIFVGNGVIFAASGMFQAFGNTVPALLASAARVAVYVVAATWVARQPWFAVEQLWYLSVATVTLQMVLVAWLLRREMRIRLAPMEAPAAGAAPAPAAA